MAGRSSSSSENESRVIRFPRRGWRGPSPAPVKSLAEFEPRESPADYRHRMVVNAAALAVVVVLMGVGLWIAETMAEMRKNEDCVLSGRRGCSPVDVNHSRW